MATTGSSYLNRTTPGVYITEIDAFGSSIVGVATAVPVFVGYTEFAGDPVTGTALHLQPVQVSSMTEFEAYFGRCAPFRYAVTDTPLRVTRLTERFALYWQMRMFFANGGGNCFVVSCGSYWNGRFPTAAPGISAAGWHEGTISAGDDESGLLTGIAAAEKTAGITMTLAPEACQLVTIQPGTGTMVDEGYGAVVSAMVAQAGLLQDRMAILDLPGCISATTIEGLTAAQRLFDAAVLSVAAAAYGAAYAPALVATAATVEDVACRAACDADGGSTNLVAILTAEANAMYEGARLADVEAAIATVFPAAGSAASAQSDVTCGVSLQAAEQLLTAALPVMLRIRQAIVADINILAPGGAVAGCWVACDLRTGVWNAPANLALVSVTAPLVAMTDAQQVGFNTPANGRVINVIRAQPQRGTVIWGARTLDGNSNEGRYVQVRRTLIYVEQSIRQALQPFVFAANDTATWSTVSTSVTSFLTGLWQQGGLTGSRPGDAFSVSCGLGQTMKADDVLDGRMIVQAELQIARPGDWLHLTFIQQTGG